MSTDNLTSETTKTAMRLIIEMFAEDEQSIVEQALAKYAAIRIPLEQQFEDRLTALESKLNAGTSDNMTNVVEKAQGAMRAKKASPGQ